MEMMHRTMWMLCLIVHLNTIDLVEIDSINTDILFHRLSTNATTFQSLHALPAHLPAVSGHQHLHELGQERNHEREQTSGFSEGETQNGILEHLVLQAGVAGKTEDEGTENNTDTSTGTFEKISN